MFKNWFLIAGVSCGVGFGSTFLISRNLQQSAWAGLGTVPAVAASLTILSRQRQEEIDRQVAKSRLSLDDLQREEQLVKEQLQIRKSSCQKIIVGGQELQTAFTQLKQDVNRYREEQAGLEREINSLVLQRQAQESSLVRLDAKVVDRQNNLQTTQAELALIQTQRQSAIDSAKQSNLELQSVREKIRQYSVTKEQLGFQLTDLQNQAQSLQTKLIDREVDLRGIEYHILQMEERHDRVAIAIVELDGSLEQKQSLLQDIDRDRQQQQALIQEISDLLLEKQDREVLLGELVVNITVKQNILFELDAEVSEGQANLDRISIDLVQIEAQRQSAIDLAQRSELTLANIQEEISNHCINKEKIAAEIAELQNRGENLEAEIVTQKINLTELQEQISALQERASTTLI
jgi:chromosome segregation ATPase